MAQIPPFVPQEPLPKFESNSPITKEEHVWKYKEIFRTRWQKTLPAVFWETITLQETVERLTHFVNQQMDTIQDALNAFLEDIKSYQAEIDGAINAQNVRINQFSESVSNFVNQIRVEVNQLQTNFDHLKEEFNDLRAENQAFQERMEQLWQTFQTTITNKFDDFTANISNQQADFEAEIRQTQSEFETNITDKQDAFQLRISNQQTTFENSINQKQTAFETTINNQISAFTSDITEKFTDLKNYVDNYFANLDLSQEVADYIDRKIADGTITADVIAGTDNRLSNRKVVWIFGSENSGTVGEIATNHYSEFNDIFGETIFYNRNNSITFDETEGNTILDTGIAGAIDSFLKSAEGSSINRLTDMVVFADSVVMNNNNVSNIVKKIDEIRPIHINLYVVPITNWRMRLNIENYVIFMNNLENATKTFTLVPFVGPVLYNLSAKGGFTLSIFSSIWTKNYWNFSHYSLGPEEFSNNSFNGTSDYLKYNSWNNTINVNEDSQHALGNGIKLNFKSNTDYLINGSTEYTLFNMLYANTQMLLWPPYYTILCPGKIVSYLKNNQIQEQWVKDCICRIKLVTSTPNNTVTISFEAQDGESYTINSPVSSSVYIYINNSWPIYPY